MWFRSAENENIWWSFGKQSFTDWYLSKENDKEKK